MTALTNNFQQGDDSDKSEMPFPSANVCNYAHFFFTMCIFLSVCISVSLISEVIQLINMSLEDNMRGQVGIARTGSNSPYSLLQRYLKEKPVPLKLNTIPIYSCSLLKTDLYLSPYNKCVSQG